MAIASDRGSEDRRTPLTRARVLEAAVALADRDGIEAVSMRNLGQELGIEAMSLYTHIRGKEDLLDGMVDAVVGEVPVDPDGPGLADDAPADDPRCAEVMLRHRWAARIIETRERARAGDPRLHGGGDGDPARWWVHGRPDASRDARLGSRVLGFNQDLFDDSGAPDPETAAMFAAQLAGAYPNIAAIAMAASHEDGLGGCDDDYRVRVRARPHPRRPRTQTGRLSAGRRLRGRVRGRPRTGERTGGARAVSPRWPCPGWQAPDARRGTPRRWSGSSRAAPARESGRPPG